nr:hypothetical protein [Kofleriaceae bacterium]
MRHLAVLSPVLASTLLAACTANVAPIYEDDGATSGASIALAPDLSGCNGKASSTIPSNGQYVMTTFGGGADTQPMSCGGEADGVGWYAASRQRYGCGSKLQVEANGKCVVVATEDYGPDVCVENAAHSPILDMSPRAAKVLWNTSEAGWSDHMVVTATEVDDTTPLGECSSTPPPPPPPTGGGNGTSTCSSSTLGRDVDDGTCVQSASDATWYECNQGTWVSVSDGTDASCSESFGFCESATLGKAVPASTCVQSAANGTWYQCNGQSWVTPVDKTDESGPIGDCSSWHPN